MRYKETKEHKEYKEYKHIILDIQLVHKYTDKR